MMKSEAFDVAVIGAGPAGLMAAYRASLRGLKVVVFDPNKKQGRKLRITGKGRCNVCNSCDIQTIMKNISSDGRFLYSSLNRFGPDDVINFFESNGVKLKIERGNRVFPQSDNANEIADCMVQLCLNNSVVFERKKIREFSEIKAKAIIIATGGCSYPLTGSDGNGYKLAKMLGHTIVDPFASLVPLESNDFFCKTLQGFAPKNVVLKLFKDGKLIYKELGEMLFTHFGVSGPLVLTASSHMRNNYSNYSLEIDFKPALDEQKLDNRILKVLSENSNKDIINVLPDVIGCSMSPIILSLSNINPSTKCNAITKKQRSSIKQLLKSFPISITGKRSIDEAIITAGGVSTKEIDPKTMRSRLNDKYYFAGEILDVDACTGGFNLQIAWSTGYVAGEEVLK